MNFARSTCNALTPGQRGACNSHDGILAWWDGLGKVPTNAFEWGSQRSWLQPWFNGSGAVERGRPWGSGSSLNISIEQAYMLLHKETLKPIISALLWTLLQL